MVGNNGEVYVYVDFKNTDTFINNLLGWDNPPRLSQICWLRLKDGNIYSLSDIRRRFFKNKKAKITKEKLIDMGFIPSPQKTCEWEIKWYLDLIGCKELEVYFHNVMQKHTEEKNGVKNLKNLHMQQAFTMN